MVKIQKTMFREYDIRGRVSDDELNKESCELIGKGFGSLLHKKNVEKVVVGFDAIDEAVKDVKEGKLDATIAQQPKLMGKQSIELLIDLLNEKTVNKSYSTPLKIIKE